MRLSNSSTSPTSIGAGGTNSTAEAESTPADQLVPNSPAQPARDSSWLELDVCRDYQRRSCPRDANTCRFAHPENNPPFKSKVTCCYDFLKDRCQREKCKYFHPPLHIKERLVNAGKQFGAMMSNTYMASTPAFPPAAIPAMQAGFATMMGGNGNVMRAIPPPPPPFYPAPMVFPYGVATDRLQICPDFMMDQCDIVLCPLVHPEPHVRCNNDSTVTVCRDFIRGGCQRPLCRYYHPPAHIFSQLESAGMPGVMAPQGMLVAPAVTPSPQLLLPVPPHTYVPMGPCPIPSYPVTTVPLPTSNVPIFPMLPSPVAVSFPPGVPLSTPSPVPTAVIPVQPISTTHMTTLMTPLAMEPPPSSPDSELVNSGDQCVLPSENETNPSKTSIVAL